MGSTAQPPQSGLLGPRGARAGVLQILSLSPAEDASAPAYKRRRHQSALAPLTQAKQHFRGLSV